MREITKMKRIADREDGDTLAVGRNAPHARKFQGRPADAGLSGACFRLKQLVIRLRQFYRTPRAL
jgi:hypothetical protein